MMAMKAKTFGDDYAYALIMDSNDPKDQKAAGRKVRNFNPTIWNAVAKQHVINANIAKFSGPLKQQLLDTGDKEIVEASPYDKIWGIGLSERDPRRFDKNQWLGTNWLGECLMAVREALR